MIGYDGVITAITETFIEISVTHHRPSACGGCAQVKQCLTASETPPVSYYQLKKQGDMADFHLGEAVSLHLPKRAFWSGILFAYLVPTLLVISGMAVGGYGFLSESESLTGMLIGGAIGLMLSVGLIRWKNATYQPVVVPRARASSSISWQQLSRHDTAS